MAQQWINPYSHQDVQWFCIGVEHILKLFILITSQLQLWKGVLEVFLIRFQLISRKLDSTVTNLPLFPSGFWLILHWWEQTPKPLNLIHSILKLWKGVFEVCSFRAQLIPNDSRSHSYESTPVLIWIHTDSALGENRLPTLSIPFSGEWSHGQGYSRGF